MMQLTLQHALPPALGTTCGHCDSSINVDDDYKYVKFILGETRFNFHELCYMSVLAAQNQFDQLFLKDKQERVH